MKKFTFPYISDFKGNIFYYSESNVYPWVEGKFVVQFAINNISSPLTLQQKCSLVNKPTYIVGDNLKEFRVYAESNNNNHGLKNVILYRDLKGKEIYLEEVLGSPNPAGSYKLTSLSDGTSRSMLFNQERPNLQIMANGTLWKRVGNTGVIAGSDVKSNPIKEFLLRNHDIKDNEIAILKFHGDQFEIKTFDFATHKTSKIASIAISQDELTACVLIGNDLEKWEVVVFDLE